MPTVPRRNIGFTPTAPLQGPRIPSGAFSVPQPVDLSPVSRTLQKVYDEEQEKADHTALLGADAALTDLSNRLLYDPDNGVLSKHGLDAPAAHQQAVEQWQKKSDEIASGLSENQRRAFQQLVASKSGELNGVLERHALSERQEIIRTSLDANLKAERTATLHNYSDPKRVEQGIAKQSAALMLAGHALGEPAEVTRQKIAEEASTIHAAVINSLLSDDKDIDAQNYFEAHKNELEPRDLLQAKDSVDLGSLRGASQRNADDIVKKTATLGGALSEAAKITDPKVREATENRIRRAYEDKTNDERIQREEAFQQAGVILEQTGDVDRIPPNIWLKLSPNERFELRHREEQRRNPREVSDLKVYSQLLNMAGISDATRQEFMNLDLYKYRNSLTAEDYKHLLNVQLGLRGSSDRAVSGEAKRQSAIAERDAAKEKQRQQAVETLRAMGVEMPDPPRAPGGPLRTPTVQLRISPKGKQVPQAWVDQAAKNPNYRKYLEHMGVVFDSTVAPTAQRSTGDINLNQR